MTIMTNNTIAPKPWRQVGLTVLPGLLLLASSIFRNMNTIWSVGFSLAFIILPSLVSLRIVIRERSLSKLPVWSMIPLSLIALWLFVGIVDFVLYDRYAFIYLVGPVALGIALLVMVKRADLVRTPAIAWGLTALGVAVLLVQLPSNGFLPRYYNHYLVASLPIILGLFLAREQGLHASLIVLPLGAALTSVYVEPEIYFWQADAGRTLVDASIPLLFMVLTPLWTLRARSVLGQAAGVLVPIAIYYLGLVLGLSTVSAVSLSRGHDMQQIYHIVSPVLLFFMLMTFVCALYGWGVRQNLPIAAEP